MCPSFPTYSPMPCLTSSSPSNSLPSSINRVPCICSIIPPLINSSISIFHVNFPPIFPIDSSPNIPKFQNFSSPNFEFEAMASSIASQKQVEIKLEVPELAANEEVWAMEQGEEEDNAFLVADNDEEVHDKSIWRDLDLFLPVGDPVKLDEIKGLYRVSRAHDSGGRCNFYNMPCRSQRKYKCSYIVRWRKADGMVQAKGEHNHKESNLPQLGKMKGYWPNECRECPFETNSAAAMRQHYGQFHAEKTLFHCDHCPALYTRPANLRKHVQRVHERAIEREKLANGRHFDEEEEDGDGIVQAKGEHKHKKFSLAKKPRHTGRQLEEDDEEAAEDNLDDLREIFATAIADELRKERQREAAAAAKAAALACSSSRVHQHLNNSLPLLNPDSGFEETMVHWESRYKHFNGKETAQNGHGSEWQDEDEENAEGGSSWKHSGFHHIFNSYFL